MPGVVNRVQIFKNLGKMIKIFILPDETINMRLIHGNIPV